MEHADPPPKAGATPNAEPGRSHSLEARMTIEIRDIGIPPRPTILKQVEQETAKDEPDFIHLARLIGQDVGLAAGVIKIANSAYFSFGKKVPTVQEALLVLGLRTVVTTVAGLSLRQVFKHVPDMERFWDASATTAEASAMLVRRLGSGIGIRPEDAHTFALFRDCGIPMLMIPFPEYRAVLAEANGEAELAFTAVENRVLGTDHAQVGANLAEDWLLPSDTCQAIRHHHDLDAPTEAGGLAPRIRGLIAVAQLAEYLVRQKAGRQEDCEWQKLGDACLACLNLTADDLPELADALLVEPAG